MVVVLNLKWQDTNTHHPIRDPDKTIFTIGDTVFIRNHTPKDTFDLKYKPTFRICK